MSSNSSTNCNCILIMGVSGSGKTTIGKMLASEVGGEFIDADEHHSAANINKMKGGDPLTDEDRENWLGSIAHLIQTHRSKQTLVVACSALKRIYRKKLGCQNYNLVYLKGPLSLIAERLDKRKNHFMPACLLDSQLVDLEEPTNAVEVSISMPPNEIVNYITKKLNLK